MSGIFNFNAYKCKMHGQAICIMSLTRNIKLMPIEYMLPNYLKIIPFARFFWWRMPVLETTHLDEGGTQGTPHIYLLPFPPRYPA